jgi:hypothetical protein
LQTRTVLLETYVVFLLLSLLHSLTPSPPLPKQCGTVNADSVYLVALPTNTYASGAHCGKYVTITRTDTGNSIKALVADSCPTCAFSPPFFREVFSAVR